MKYSSKVLWGEGLFLRPQHFQLQDAYHESRLAELGRMLNPYAWGIRSLKIDSDALAASMLRILEVSAVFPDGEQYNAPANDELPEALSLEVIASGTSEMTFHLALPPIRESGTNFSSERVGANAVRYYQADVAAADLFTNAVEGRIAVLKKAVRLLPDTASRVQLATIACARVRRTSTDGYELDHAFLPPAISIVAVPMLFGQLRGLLDVLQAKVNALYGFHREPSKHVIEFRSGDVASFWLLHTASSAFAALSHLFHHPQLPPERLFQQMLELAGALMTFSKSYTLADLPVYSHVDPGPAFVKLHTIVRNLLDTVISTRYFSIALTEQEPSYYVGHLDSERINAETALYVAVQAEMQPVELVQAVPMRFKIGAPDDVKNSVLSSMPGVRIAPAPQVPAAIPVRPGTYYFSVDPRGALYDRMLQAKSVMIYAPSGMPDLKLELIAVTS